MKPRRPWWIWTGLLAVASVNASAGGTRQVIAEFKKGTLQGLHGGKPFSYPLHSGTLAGGTTSNGLAFKSLDLFYASNDKVNPGNAGLVFGPLPQPGASGVPVNFMVGSKSLGTSRMVAPHSTCTFKVVKADASGVEGNGTCTGEMWDILKNTAMPSVTDVRFTALP